MKCSNTLLFDKGGRDGGTGQRDEGISSVNIL